MQRKSFLKSLMLGTAAAPALLAACGKATEVTPATATATAEADLQAATKAGASSGCSVMPTETEGPFPTHTPASYVRADITDGRTGYVLTVNITVVSASGSCSAVSGALVDIWHCDREGNYSEYGGTGMQSTNYTSVHFLRGRQVTSSAGVVKFTTIFPGWYSGRATHIHVHVYSATGQSLLVTQISFPEGTGSAVAAVNGYAKGMSGYTYNAADNVFSDDSTNSEVAVVTGSTSAGFVLNKKITVR